MAYQLIRRPLLVTAVLLTILSGVRSGVAQQGPTAAAESHLGRGYDALKQEQYELAVKEFRAALKLDPTLIQRAQFPLAVSLFEMQQPTEARREFESLRRELGDHPNILYYLGRLDVDSNNFKGAIQNLNKAVVKPPFPDTAYYLGYAFLKDGNLAAAEKWLKTAAQFAPSDSRVQYQLGKVYREQKRNEEAKKAFAMSEQLRERDENNSRLKVECGQALDKGLRKEAQATCEQLYDPDNIDRLTALGTIYGQHGDLQGALKCFRRAAELAPQSPQTQYNLALTYYQLGQFAEARVPLETALRRWTDLFQLNALYGAVLVKLGEDVAGYQALRHAQELNPQDSGTAELLYVTTLQLAQKSQNDRDYSGSLRYLQQAAMLRPAESEPHRRMAEIYSLTAHAAQASAEQREADRLNKNSAN
ncbi:MAG: tetratricopeptide repeat protein [Acidobacteria bacterium]|nr:tetratricopeptide repeat protein [Acidobacteriota bacterium]